jgi:hypothetical protein
MTKAYNLYCLYERRLRRGRRFGGVYVGAGCWPIIALSRHFGS